MFGVALLVWALAEGIARLVWRDQRHTAVADRRR